MTNNSISFVSLSLDNGSRMTRQWLDHGSTIPRKLFSLLFVLFFAIGQMWATHTVVKAGDMVSGEKYIIAAGTSYYLVPNSYSQGASGSLGTYSSSLTEAAAWTFTKSSDTWTISTKVGNTTYYLGHNNDNNGVRTNTTSQAYTISATSSGASTVYLVANSRYLSCTPANSNWRCYKNTNTGTVTLTLYRVDASCSSKATVSAGSNSSVTATTATVTCSSGISSLGSAGCSITDYGFVIGTSSNPTIGGSGVTKHQVGTTYTSTGTSFYKDLTGLYAETTYYVRPYAINGNGTAYGTQTSFTTPALPKYKITYNAGTGTCGTTSWTQPSYGASTTLPTATPPATCSGWTFAGWCTSSAGSAEDNTTSPGTILKGSYTPTGDITLYAVYTKSENSSTPTTESYGFESTDDDTNWEFSGVEANTGYHKTGSKAGKIARSSTGNSTITFKNKVNVTAFSFQFMRQTTNNNYNVYIETSTDKSSWSAVETYAMSSFTSAETWYAKSHDFDGKTALYVRIKCYTTSAIRWVDDISITYTGGSTTYYMTSLVCCTPLASINGSFFRCHFLGRNLEFSSYHYVKGRFAHF